MTAHQAPAAGFVAPRIVAIRDAFSEVLAVDGEELGASLGVYADGEKMVDLWGGIADPACRRPWDADTVSVIFSATKGAVTILAWLLAQRGVLDFDAPATAYWPEFAGGGKSTVPVRYLFTHQADLPYLDQQPSREELLDSSRIVEVLEQQAPVWVPGSGHGVALGFADARHWIGFGYVQNRLLSMPADRPHTRGLIAAVREAVGTEPTH